MSGIPGFHDGNQAGLAEEYVRTLGINAELKTDGVGCPQLL
jgi:hypothetical protein